MALSCPLFVRLHDLNEFQFPNDMAHSIRRLKFEYYLSCRAISFVFELKNNLDRRQLNVFIHF